MGEQDLAGLLEEFESDPTNEDVRAILADALEDAGRNEEAALLRDGSIVVVHGGIVYNSRSRHYAYHEEGGHSEPIEASSIEEALGLAVERAQEGDWGIDGAVIQIWVTETNDLGEETDRRGTEVEIPPDHEELIRRADRDGVTGSCGNDPDDHEWSTEGEGGSDHNPGVWSLGGTRMAYRHHCSQCGLVREAYEPGGQRDPGEGPRYRYYWDDEV